MSKVIRPKMRPIRPMIKPRMAKTRRGKFVKPR